MTKRCIIMTNRPNLAHVRSHLPSQNVGSLKRFEFFFMVKAVSIWFKAEQFCHALVLCLPDQFKNSSDLLALLCFLHLPVEDVSNGKCNHAFFAPLNDSIHTHPHGEGIMLSPIVAANAVRGSIPDCFRNSDRNSDSLVFVYDSSESPINVAV